MNLLELIIFSEEEYFTMKIFFHMQDTVLNHTSHQTKLNLSSKYVKHIIF
jgi:hypothetical protein